MCWRQGFVARNEKGPRGIAEALRQITSRGLVIAQASVVARPPIGAAGGIGPLAQPVAVVTVGVVVGTVNPDPGSIPEDPVTIVEAVVVVVVVALGNATIAVAMVAVALVMAAVAIEGLGIAATGITFWPRATEIARVRARTAIGAATTVVGESARAARAAA
jgi:hypothetical protein